MIVCDGTMVGMRKDLLPFAHENRAQEALSLPVIKGSTHSDRVLIKSKKARDLLLKYSGYRRTESLLPVLKCLQLKNLISLLNCFVQMVS